MTLIFKISLSFSQILQCFECVQWLSLQLLQFKLLVQVSSVWSGSCALHFTRTDFLEQASFKCPYFWQLWHLLSFISGGCLELLKVCMCSLMVWFTFLIVILIDFLFL